jgi:hypothetical protein
MHQTYTAVSKDSVKSFMFAQNTIGAKVDVNGRKMDVLRLVLGCGCGIERIDFHEHLFISLLR